MISDEKLALFKEKQLAKKKKKQDKERKRKQDKRDKIKAREKKKEETRKRAIKKKREAYKPIHVKNLRKKQNARAYRKIKKARLAEHYRKGDVHGYYRIVLTKDYQQIKELSPSWWLLTAYDKFNKYVEENNHDVICEKTIVQSVTNKTEPVKYEILLLKKIDPDADNGVREHRNEFGMFVENKIKNNNKYAIIAKSDWYIPETYNVYGYNPVSDRKTGRWIYDNIINKDCTKENLKNVFMCHNKLIIQYTTDIDFVICKNADECLKLYNALQAETPKKNKYVIYSAYIAQGRISWLYDLIEEKTGWNRNMIVKTQG